MIYVKKVSIYNFICSFIIFILGGIYLSFPTYYGLEAMSEIETGNLFLSFIIIYSLLNLTIFFINHERYNLKISVFTSLSGLVAFILTRSINSFLVTPVSLMVLLFFISSIKMIDIFYLKETFGIILAFNMLNDFVLQTIMLGFFISLIGTIDFIDYSWEFLLKNEYIKVMK